MPLYKHTHRGRGRNCCESVVLPSTVQFRAQTTCPSESTVWFGGKLRLTVKVVLPPVRVGASFFRSNVTSPPGNNDHKQHTVFIFKFCIITFIQKHGVFFYTWKLKLTHPTVSKPGVSILPDRIHPGVPWTVPRELASAFCKDKMKKNERLKNTKYCHF